MLNVENHRAFGIKDNSGNCKFNLSSTKTLSTLDNSKVPGLTELESWGAKSRAGSGGTSSPRGRMASRI